jgi:hypothetical protein
MGGAIAASGIVVIGALVHFWVFARPLAASIGGPMLLLLLITGLIFGAWLGLSYVVAEFERAMIAERVRAGLARARSEGKRLGRPPIAPALEKRIREALATPGRPGVRVIAKQFGVDPGTVQRISRPFDRVGIVAA